MVEVDDERMAVSGTALDLTCEDGQRTKRLRLRLIVLPEDKGCSVQQMIMKLNC